MMCAMSASKDSKRPASAARAAKGPSSDDGTGVLSGLPRTRPQRSSPRRAAARKATAAATKASAHTDGRPPARPGKAAAGATAKHSAKPPGATAKRAVKPAVKRIAKPSAVAEPAPRQGFESDSERASGSVHPPGGAELVASAAEIVGELAKAGIATGERLLKDVFSRLPLA
jgi:hypothetical protein